MATNDLTNRINELYRDMSKGQRRIAAYITEHFDKAAFFTASKLGKEVGVSESTVVRFAMMLGYKGYPEFQRALEQQIHQQLSGVNRMEETYGSLSDSGILLSMLKSDRERIKKTMEHLDATAFDSAVESIAGAKKVYLIGLRSCAPLAAFFAFYLHMMRDNVVLLRTSSDNEIFEQLLRISEKDCIVGISFPRYSIRTLKAMEFANRRNAKVITLTDNVHSPMNLYSSCNLIAATDTSSIVESMVAPMSVINALIVAIGMKKSQEVAKNLDLLEQLWEEYQVSGNDELDYVDDLTRLRFERLGGLDA